MLRRPSLSSIGNVQKIRTCVAYGFHKRHWRMAASIRCSVQRTLFPEDAMFGWSHLRRGGLLSLQSAGFSTSAEAAASNKASPSKRYKGIYATLVVLGSAAVWYALKPDVVKQLLYSESASDSSKKRQMTEKELISAPFDVAYPEASVELKALLGDRYSVDEGHLIEHGKEITGYAARANPQVVVWPTSTQEVSDIVKICAKYKVPIVPYAGGTSLEGHTSVVRGGLTLQFSLMNKVVAFHKEDMDVVVQPGIGWMELNKFLEPHGFLLGVDPGPGACIGGMCATGCSGTNAVRYGTMKDQVINLTVVLADGTIMKTRQRPRKSSAGYDVARLIVGSEGTLGIVTEATLKLQILPEVIEVAYVNFDSVTDATNAVIEILQKGIQLGAIELIDEVMAKALNEYAELTFAGTPAILFKFTGWRTHVQADIKEVEKICKKYTQHPYVWCDTKESSDRLWTARKEAFWAIQAKDPEKELMSTDVAVPISCLAKAVMDTKKDVDESFLYAAILGHVGDGNYHTAILFNPQDPKEEAEAHRLNERMVHRAQAMEGTCTGEHGVGLGKMKYLVGELGQPTVDFMRKIKKTLDPDDIFNPGKVIPP